MVFTELLVTQTTKDLQGPESLLLFHAGFVLPPQIIGLKGASTGTVKQCDKSPCCIWALQPPGDSENWEADVNQHVGAKWAQASLKTVKFSLEEPCGVGQISSLF